MKIRQGFVSNSSSSSFTCDVCGHETGGFDVGLRDCDMCRCEEGHEMCNDHVDRDKEDEIKERLEREWNPDEHDGCTFHYDGIYYLPIELCPICEGSVIMENTISALAIAKTGQTREELKAELKACGNLAAQEAKIEEVRSEN